MSFFSYTNTISNGIAADGNNVMTNFNDVRSALIDGTKDINISDITVNNQSASTVPYFDSVKLLKSSTVTPTELGYLSGLTSSAQTQLTSLFTNIRIPRPSFNWNSSDTSQMLVPASSAKPAIVKIGTTFYTNTSTATLDLDTSGRNGLDTGSKAANTVYYLYAIPPTSGTTFDVVCSVSDPNTGPTGFASWSYLGSFKTVGSSAIPECTYANGIFQYMLEATDITFNSSVNSNKTINSSNVSTSVHVRCTWTAINSAGDTFSIGPSTSNEIIVLKASATTVSGQSPKCVWITTPTARQIGGQVSTSTSDSVDVKLLGWMENPTNWQ